MRIKQSAWRYSRDVDAPRPRAPTSIRSSGSMDSPRGVVVQAVGLQRARAVQLLIKTCQHNQRRLHSTLGNVPPIEYEQAHYAALNREPHPV
jgi:hypothetical protein